MYYLPSLKYLLLLLLPTTTTLLLLYTTELGMSTKQRYILSLSLFVVLVEEVVDVDEGDTIVALLLTIPCVESNKVSATCNAAA